MNQPQLENDIGTVLIVKDAIRLNGKHYIESREVGNPKGPLAKPHGLIYFSPLSRRSCFTFWQHGLIFRINQGNKRILLRLSKPCFSLSQNFCVMIIRKRSVKTAKL